jgi:plastocyanin
MGGCSFAQNSTPMRKTATLLACLPLALFAQTTWDVEAGGTLSDPNNLPYYDPMELTIEQGDIVHWTNIEGTHNVNGQLNLFPNNPEGFGNGQPAGAPWEFSYTFTIVGVYEYHCTQTFAGQSHSTTQHGMITVVEPQSVREESALGTLRIYPVPASTELTVQLENGSIRSVELMSIDGRVVLQQAVNGGALARLDVEALPAGRFFLRLTNTAGLQVVRPFVKN